VLQKYFSYINRYLFEVQRTMEYGSNYKLEQKIKIYGLYKYFCKNFRQNFIDLF